MSIGETEQILLKQFQGHIHDLKGDVDRRIYRHLQKLGPSNWILFSLQKFNNKLDLLVVEKTWMHSKRGYLINDPFNWTKNPKQWDPITKKYSKKFSGS